MVLATINKKYAILADSFDIQPSDHSFCTNHLIERGDKRKSLCFILCLKNLSARDWFQ